MDAQVIWFTGLSGAGKTTLSQALCQYLLEQGERVYLLDGDQLRSGLNADLGFSEADRLENVRRIGEVARLFFEQGYIVIVACISPYKQSREAVRRRVGSENFVEVYINTSLALCEARDPKGLYAKARRGEINTFTGISSPYERPENPSLFIDTDNKTVNQCLNLIKDYLLHY